MNWIFLHLFFFFVLFIPLPPFFYIKKRGKSNHIKKGQYYKDHKDEYEKERSEWKQDHQKSVRESREEKEDIKTKLVSNLEKPSEIAQDLLEEGGPSYTDPDD